MLGHFFALAPCRWLIWRSSPSSNKSGVNPCGVHPTFKKWPTSSWASSWASSWDLASKVLELWQKAKTKSVRYSDRDQSFSPAAQEGLGCMTFIRNLMWMTTGSIALIVVLAFGNAWQSGERLLDRLVSFVNPPPPEPQVDVRSLVINQVRDASELTTAIFTMEAVIPTSQDQTLGGFLVGTTKLLYIAHGEVRAGVDLSQLTPESIVIEGDTIRLRLPPPRILDSKIDVSRSTVYDYDRGFLGLGPDVAPNLQNLAEEQALSRITQAACGDNILQRANERAKLVVTQLLQGMGDRQVIVETQLPDAAACLAGASPAPQGVQPSTPPSVAPTAPLGQPTTAPLPTQPTPSAPALTQPQR